MLASVCYVDECRVAHYLIKAESTAIVPSNISHNSSRKKGQPFLAPIVNQNVAFYNI